MKSSPSACIKQSASSYHLDDRGCFHIDDYNHQKTFSNFFPGIAGLWGTPMWVFYVNRGQCISSFGTESKDKAILEFQPANKAYQLTSLQGFRTFLKIRYRDKIYFWEPFQNHTIRNPFRTRQKMSITAHDLVIEDINATLGLIIQVNYFCMPGESFSALIRRWSITNISKKKYQIELIDGLPIILPYGMTDWTVKHMSRTVEAWSRVQQVRAKTPFYHLKVEVSDTPKIQHIEQGHFYLSFNPKASKPKLYDAIVQRECVFGYSSDLRTPERFFKSEIFKVPQNQQTENRTPSALSYAEFSLSGTDAHQVVSLIGHANSLAQLKKIVPQVMTKGFIEKKASLNQDVIKQIKNYTLTNSSSREFNMYCTQTFLDNILRGGLPITFKTGAGNIVVNIFSRKHGDLERDYNFFVLSPTPFSQGNGNYRDVNQNRRNDVWFNPDVCENHIVDFLNLVQADGYNPLVVKGLSFMIEDSQKLMELLEGCAPKDQPELKLKLKDGFQPGELLDFIEGKKIKLKVTRQKFLNQVMAVSVKQVNAEHGEGFWTDHWTYNLDLIESFVTLYPEKLMEILFEKKIFYFYLNSHYVLPRDKRYVMTSQGVRQYHSVFNGYKEIQADKKGNKLRCRNGQGDIYKTVLITKLLCLIANKAATFDPSGIGIEMEADKPNWYDALNGLPGILGSSLSETLELKRLCLFLKDAFNQLNLDDHYHIQIFEELVDFIRELAEILVHQQDSLDFWRRANDVKEHYRSRIRCGIAGEEQQLTIKEIRDFLDLIIQRTDQAIGRAKDPKGFLATYFYHEVVDFDQEQHASGILQPIRPKRFRLHRLPLFLEGFVHTLRVEQNRAEAKRIFQRVQNSDLFDKKLRMYKVNADLSKETEEIGRTSIFPPGWLENGSIWLHMEYKYLLELLRCDLYDEFFTTFKDVLVPFLNPERYGRSILENSSFIVSSEHSDVSLHGQGYVARLSGITAEFLHMWLWLNTGKNPFQWDAVKGLSLKFRPLLPGWLFTKSATQVQYLNVKGQWQTVALPANTYSFNFLGSILTVYHNPKRQDTFARLPIRKIHLSYVNRQHPVVINGELIRAPYAHDVRDKKVNRIDVFLE